MSANTPTITVNTQINQSSELTWETFNTPAHMQGWARSSADWIVKETKNDLKIGGEIKVILTTKEGNIFLQYCGIYEAIELNKLLKIKLEDGRNLEINFNSIHDITNVTLTIDEISMQPTDTQEICWQSLLDNLKTYAESISEEVKNSDSFYEK